MKCSLLLSCAFAGIFLAAPLSAQVRVPRVTAPGSGTKPAATGTQHQPPCWEQAGISKAAMQQRRQIQQETQSQVQAVCADSSLTPQQKAAKIREIHQQAHQQSEALITPAQTEAMKACQQERAANAPHPPVPHPGTPHPGAGPCGEMIPAAAPPSKEPGTQSEEQPQ